MSHLIRFVALLALTLTALVGCEKVEFQSPPSWPLEQCNSRFVGDWRVEDAQSPNQSDEQMYIRVAAECVSWLGVEVDGSDPTQVKVEDMQAEMSLRFARSANHEFVVTREQADPKQTDPAAKPEGYVLASFELVDEVLELRLLDPAKTAHLIIDGVVPGWVEKRDRAPDGSLDPYAKRFDIYVFGDPEQTKQLLDSHVPDLLEPVWLRLHRVDAHTSEQISAWTADGPTKPANKP